MGKWVEVVSRDDGSGPQRARFHRHRQFTTMSSLGRQPFVLSQGRGLKKSSRIVGCSGAWDKQTEGMKLGKRPVQRTPGELQ